MILLNTPKTGEAGWVDDFEDTCAYISPGDVSGISAISVIEQLLEEVPQEAAVGAGLHRLVRTLLCLLRSSGKTGGHVGR